MAALPLRKALRVSSKRARHFGDKFAPARFVGSYPSTDWRVISTLNSTATAAATVVGSSKQASLCTTKVCIRSLVCLEPSGQGPVR